jgi:hypothetical protein
VHLLNDPPLCTEVVPVTLHVTFTLQHSADDVTDMPGRRSLGVSPLKAYLQISWAAHIKTLHKKYISLQHKAAHNFLSFSVA